LIAITLHLINKHKYQNQSITSQMIRINLPREAGLIIFDASLIT